MLSVTNILGQVDDERFSGRARDAIMVDWVDATRRRLRIESTAGVDVAVDLPRGTFLFDGAVLHDDGECVVVVVRKPTLAVIIGFDDSVPRGELIRSAALVGHAFGNQHAPIEIAGSDLIVPVATSVEIACATVEKLGVSVSAMRVSEVPIARTGPIGPEMSHHDHHHGHDAEHSA